MRLARIGHTCVDVMKRDRLVLNAACEMTNIFTFCDRRCAGPTLAVSDSNAAASSVIAYQWAPGLLEYGLALSLAHEVEGGFSVCRLGERL